MIEISMIVDHEVGLHARPASIFVKTAGTFQSQIRIRNATSDSDWVDAKSILSVLTLGVESGHSIDLAIDGPDERSAGEALTDLIVRQFEDKVD